MLTTKMAFAIFWLPLIAGLLLGGLAVGAWYGGNKTLAIWVGFIGAICFLLTAALQFQQYAWTVANQPHLALVTSDEPSFLRWDPPTSLQMQTNNTTNPAYGTWMVPKLRIRNTGQFAQDATVKWGVTPYEREALVSSSLRLKNANVILESNKITLAPKSGSATPWQHVAEWSASLPFPFITRETETFIPLTIWENAAFFFIATMPEQPDASSEPFFFDVQISWNIPEDGQPQRFRVKALAHDARLAAASSPVFLAKIELQINDDQLR